jgi:DNA-binding response OmpR family regulator
MANILIYDDSMDSRDILYHFLKILGHGVAKTDNAESFLHQFQMKKPDLVIFDLLVLDQDQLQLCSRIAAEMAVNKVPILLMSSCPDIMLKFKQCHATDYLSKPFEMRTLKEQVNALLSGAFV